MIEVSPYEILEMRQRNLFAWVLRSGIALILRLSNEPLAEPTGRLTYSEKHSQTQNARKN